MGLANLVRTIREEGAERVLIFAAQKDRELEARKKELYRLEKERAVELLRATQHTIDQKINRAKQKAASALQTAALIARQKTLDGVYEEAANLLGELSQKDLLPWIVSLIAHLPTRTTTPQFMVSTDWRTALEAACKQTSCTVAIAVKPLEDAHGFRFESEEIAMDFTVPTLITTIREQTETDVAKILFS